MAKLKSIPKQKLNALMKRLPVPVQDHSRRCKMLASYLVDRLRTEEWFIDAKLNAEEITSAVFYHDIGKIRVPKDNLYLAHCNTSTAKDIYRSHVEEAAPLIETTVETVLANYKDTSFGGLLYKAVAEHHELCDGTGFPDRKKADDISFVAKLTAVVDTFDNLMFVGASENYDFDKAVLTLVDMSSKKLDSHLVEVFVSEVETLRSYVEYICSGEEKRHKKDTYGIHIVYDPVYSASEEKIVSFIAKIMLNDPFYGNVSQDKIISVANKTGQIFKLQKMAVDRLVRDVANAKKTAAELPKVWFAVSARHFEKKKFFTELEKIFAKYSLDNQSIGFNVSEADIFTSDLEWQEIIDEFRMRGWQFAVDDFGNRSSLFTSFDEISPDRIVFSSDLAHKATVNPKTADIVSGFIDITRKLDVPAVFTGVSDKKEEATLVHMGVKLLSGSLYGQDLSAKDMASMCTK